MKLINLSNQRIFSFSIILFVALFNLRLHAGEKQLFADTENKKITKSFLEKRNIPYITLSPDETKRLHKLVSELKQARSGPKFYPILKDVLKSSYKQLFKPDDYHGDKNKESDGGHENQQIAALCQPDLMFNCFREEQIAIDGALMPSGRLEPTDYARARLNYADSSSSSLCPAMPTELLPTRVKVRWGWSPYLSASVIFRGERFIDVNPDDTYWCSEGSEGAGTLDFQGLSFEIDANGDLDGARAAPETAEWWNPLIRDLIFFGTSDGHVWMTTGVIHYFVFIDPDNQYLESDEWDNHIPLTFIMADDLRTAEHEIPAGFYSWNNYPSVVQFEIMERR